MNQSTAITQPRPSRWIPFFMALVTGVLLLLALPGAGLADDATTAGPATATPGKATKTAGAAKITVNIPYSGDANGNNSALIQWDEDGGDWNNLIDSQALAHSTNPYSYEITGLDNSVTYQIRVTITDPDGGSNLVQTLTGLKPYNLLLHNAVSTGSSKWSSNWGLIDTGSQYGEITCSTCHATSTGNIKRVKETVTAANSPTHNFPGSAVAFLDARDGTSHFGDDSGGRTTSNRICEVCHSATAYHRYDATTNPGGTTHYNGRDCMECHAHNNAFKANCTSCHGDTATGVMWPDSNPADSYADRAGAHLTHVEQIGNTINAAGGGPGIATLADKNASCVYCHPQPGGTNRDGAGHTDNTLNSPADVADVFNDGINLPGEGSFKYINGSTDSDGLYNPNIKRCSNIDCHSNGDFTWTWYEDATAPGRITDLVGSTGSEVGTVGLTWTAPNNDGAIGPVAYGYEVRYRTDGAVTDANWSSSTIAGGAPGAVRTYVGDSLNQTMTVYGLTPGTTYYFAVKAFDETMTNYALASNSVSAVAKTDSAVPFFKGLEVADPAMASGKANLSWSAAKDVSEPISYKIFWAPTSTAINYNSVQATTSGLTYQVSGLADGTNYNFAVRAEDAVGNRETNTVQKEAIPQTPYEKDWNGTMFFGQMLSGHSCGGSYTYSSGTLTGALSTAGNPCSPTTRTRLQDITGTGDKLIWRMPTSVGKTMNVTGGNLTMYWRESDEVTGGQGIQAHIGYTTDGTNYSALGSVTKTIPGGHRGYFSIGLSTISGQIPANGRVVVKIAKVLPNTSNRLELRYGSNRYQTFFTLFMQENNARPNAFTLTAPAAASAQSGEMNIAWNAAVDPDGDPVGYDIYGSIDNGATYPFVIATGVTGTSTTWDTVKSGLGLTAPLTTAKVKVAAGDGMSHNEGGTYYDHREAISGTFTINNSVDSTAPAAVTDLHAEHRPKTGTVWLYWHAPGDDDHEGQASQYDIRYKLADVNSDGDEADASDGPIDSTGKWDISTPVVGEPLPGDPGHRQGYEILGLNPGKSYYFALKTADEVPNWSGLSNSPKADGGLRCGVCHSTPPDDAATKGMHKEHGFTQTDCAKCHGQEADTFDTRHMDGVTRVAWNNAQKLKDLGGTWNVAVGPTTETAVSIVYKNQAGTVTIYDDATGGGGFNDVEPGGDNLDNGTCFGFNATGVTGCHGVGAPEWGNIASVNCAMCHGAPNRDVNSDYYGRPYEDPTVDNKYAGGKRVILAAPPIDLLGNTGGKAVGQHMRHLNLSYRLTGDSCTLCHKGSDHADGTVDVVLDTDVSGGDAQWNPGAGATPGTCTGTSELRCHGNNSVDPVWTTRTGDDATGPKLVYCNECHGHQDNNYHEGASWPVTEHTATVGANLTGNNSTAILTVNSGHTMVAGDHIIKGHDYFKVTAITSTSLTFHKPVPVGINFSSGEVLTTKHIPHTVDGGVVRACTWCHVEGHPQGATPAGDAVVMVPNYAISGIDYTSGGIHLRKVINSRATLNSGAAVDSEAEICWACHEDNGISEWGTNTDANTGNMSYNYGTLHNNAGSWGSRTAVSSWVGATWDSPSFRYKTGAIASTHSVNPAVTGPGVDTEAQIRCAYCHDVHDMNLALNDTLNGKPFLRGTWKGNPYKEDGAPGRNESFRSLGTVAAKIDYYPYNDDFGAVPRGSTGITSLGGYFIDQNSGYPASSFTLSNSAGLCVLCHGGDVNNMNKFGNPADDWIGTNGHSNSAVGGSGANKANIYNPSFRNEGTTWNDPGMGYQGTTLKTAEEMFGLRNYDGDTPTSSTDSSSTYYSSDNSIGVTPYIWSTDLSRARFAFGEFAWALDRTNGAIDLQYHRFSCSKCHNPHASRLPRLMITNCLDVSHNKWDDLFAGDADWTSGGSGGTTTNWSTSGVMPYTGNDVSGLARNKQLAYATSAQNCHRYVNVNNDTTPEEAGWNKVTPWVESGTNYTNN